MSDKEIREYIAFMNDPANIHKCHACPANRNIKKTANGWNLIGVHRDTCRTKRYILDLPEAAKRALVARCTRF